MCLDDQILNTYLDHELQEPWKSQVEEHLSYCQSCKKRFGELQRLNGIIKSAELSDEEIKPRQERVLAMLENNYLSKKKKVSFFARKLQLSVRSCMGIAAAFVIVFVGTLAVFGGKNASTVLLPEPQNNISIGNITPVRATEVTKQNKSLDDYSLDELIKNIDARGYDVDIKLKSIKPVDF